MEDFSQIEFASNTDVFSATELRSEIESFRDIDYARLSKKAIALAPGTGMEPNDLLQEALFRALKEKGGRNCPCNVNPAIFLGNVMRSIATHARLDWAREVPACTTGEDESGPIENTPDSAPSPEEATIAHLDYGRIIDRLEEMFRDDPKAQAIIIGDMEGWTPDEIREMEPMSTKEYDTARKRVRRSLLREFPEDPTNE